MKPKTSEQLVRALIIAVKEEQQRNRDTGRRSYLGDLAANAAKKVAKAQNELLAALDDIGVPVSFRQAIINVLSHAYVCGYTKDNSLRQEVEADKLLAMLGSEATFKSEFIGYILMEEETGNVMMDEVESIYRNRAQAEASAQDNNDYGSTWEPVAVYTGPDPEE